MKNLIQKYNIPGPRYTSYPTVPYWDKEGITIDNWKRSTLKAFNESNDSEGLAYIFIFHFVKASVPSVLAINELPKDIP